MPSNDASYLVDILEAAQLIQTFISALISNIEPLIPSK